MRYLKTASSVNLLFLYLLFSIISVQKVVSQASGTPANFGIDSSGYSGTPFFGSDDWFQGFSGDGVLDESNTATFLNQLSNNQNVSFDVDMDVPKYSRPNGYILYDAKFIRDQIKFSGGNGDGTTFTGAKNGQNPEDWVPSSSGNISGSNDIVDGYIHMRRDGATTADDLWMMMGVTTLETNGDHFFDFEMYFSDLTFTGTGFINAGPEEGHNAWDFDASGEIIQTGDLSVGFAVSGGGITNFEVRIWTSRWNYNNISPAQFAWGSEFDGAKSNSVYGYASIIVGAADFFAVTNGSEATAPPWGTHTAGAVYSTTYPANYFAEVAVNLSAIGLNNFLSLPGVNPCLSPFAKVMAKSRSSQSFTSALGDFTSPVEFSANSLIDSSSIEIADLHSCGSPSILVPTNPVIGAYYEWTTVDGLFSNGTQSSIGDTAFAELPGTYMLSTAPLAECTRGTTEITIDAHPCAIDNIDTVAHNSANQVMDVVSNDFDLDDDIDLSSIDVSGLMAPSNGSVSTDVMTGELIYTPATDFIGLDSLEYRICDLAGQCDTAMVIIYVLLDTDNDGIIDIIDIDDDNDGIPDLDECLAGVATSMQLSNALADGLEGNNSVIFPLDPYGSATLPMGGVEVHSVGATSADSWRIYSPTVPDGEILINQVPFTFDTDYLDLINDIPRTILVDFGVSAISLSIGSDRNHRYFMGIAGLGLEGPFVTATSSEELTVIGNVDCYSTNYYSDLDGVNNPPAGTVGTVISTASPLTTNQGYTFYFLPEDISNFVLDYTGGNDPHGFIIGVVSADVCDIDSDGIPNDLDLDSDNDGIYDLVEAGHTAIDADNNGVIDGPNSAFGINGLFDNLETSADNDIINYSISDSDVNPDGIYDAYELDADGDGCFDTTEENVSDLDNDGIAGSGTPTVDINGLVISAVYADPISNTWQDNVYVALVCDTDDDLINPEVDIDDDNDGITDVEENSVTIPNYQPSCVTDPIYDFSSVPTLLLGTDREVGAVYRFANVNTGVDAIVTIEDLVDVTIPILDDNSTNPMWFNPQSAVSLTDAGDVGYQQYLFQFVESGTTIPLDLAVVNLSFNDVDGNDSYGEISAAQFPESYTYDNPTELSFEMDTYITATAGTTEYPGVTGDNPQVNYYVQFTNTSAFRIRFGVKGHIDNVATSGRQHSLSFSCPDNFADPYTVRTDIDEDGIPNYLDLDSDNDGIYDLIEAGHNGADANDDGIIDGAPSTFGINGLHDTVETAPDNGIINYSISDSESSPDSIYDAYELDSDGDGCFDVSEVAISDSDMDGLVGAGTPVVDDDGRVTSITYGVPPDSSWQDPFVATGCYTGLPECFLAADNSELLSSFDLATTAEMVLGNHGIGQVEAIEFDPLSKILYGAAHNELYRFDTMTAAPIYVGVFSPFGDADGTMGILNFGDIDGLARDPINDKWYASARVDDNVSCGLPDVLFQFDPITALFIPGAFDDFNGDGFPDDYVVIEKPSIETCLNLIDDMGFDPFTSTLYGVANGEGAYSNQTVLLTIDPLTGETSSPGNVTYDNGSSIVNLRDIEGLTITLDNRVLVTSGPLGNPANSIFELSGLGSSSITATLLGQLSYEDYEGITCLTLSNPSSIGEIVYIDSNSNGVYDSGETGIDSVLLFLVNPTTNDTLSQTWTDPTGAYLFEGLYPGSYEVHISLENYSVDNSLFDHTISADPDATLDGVGTTFPMIPGDQDLSMNFGFTPPYCRTATMNPHVMYFRRN